MAVEERKASEGENTSQGNLGRLELFEFGLGFLRHRLWLKSESRASGHANVLRQLTVEVRDGLEGEKC